MAEGLYKRWLEDDYLELLKGWKRNGLTDKQISKNMDISYQTLKKWKAKYPEIKQALKVGREIANFYVEGKLYKKAMDGNTTAMIFWLKNNWRDKYNDSRLSKEERELAKAQAEKMIAEAGISKAKLKELTELDDTNTNITIVNDFDEAPKDINDVKKNDKEKSADTANSTTDIANTDSAKNKEDVNDAK